MPPPPAPKRPYYFQSQFLLVRDFQDEQNYHEESLRRHNRLMHEWGVIREGLKVSKTGGDFVISPGSAIDSLGREIVLEAARTLSAAEVQTARSAAGQDVYVTIAFQEADSKDANDKYPPPGGTENVTRKVPSPLIVATRTVPDDDGTVIILARIAGDNTLPIYARKLASSFIPRGTNLGDISLDGALSFTSKTSPVPQVGVDYDPATDQLRIRARSQNASALDTTHLTIKRDSGNVGIGTTEAPGHKLEVAGSLKLTKTAVVNSDHTAAYFWNQAEVGATIGGHGFEVRTSAGISLRINSAGNVAIGTTVPATKLHIAGNGNGMPEKSGNTQSGGHLIRLRGSQSSQVLDIGAAAEKGFWLQSTDLGDLTKSYPLLLNPNGGNIGIGTTEPATRLHVVGSGSAEPAIAGTTQSAGHVARLKGSTVAILDIGAGEKSFWLQSTDVTNLSASHSLLLNPNAGDVGIGTKITSAKLHVAGPANSRPALLATTLSSGPVARLKGNTDSILEIGAASDNGFLLQATELDKATVTHPLLLNPNGGNVGIGTKSPKTSLYIRKDAFEALGPTLTLMNGSGGSHAKVQIDLHTYSASNKPAPSGRIICDDSGSSTGHLIFQTKKANSEDMLDRIRIDAGGTVEVHDDLKVSGRISCGGKIAIKSSQWTNRYISARAGAGAGAGTTDEGWKVTTWPDKLSYEEFTIEMACSREYKENISDLTAVEAMNTLHHLIPVKYDYKGQKAFRQNLGFIAEDMPDNLSSEDRKSISPFEVVPILTRVAKEQQRVIAELQETVRTLQIKAIQD